MGRSCVQGSVLVPKLWLIYIQSLLDRLEHKCIYYAYADDVTIIAKISTKKEIKRFQKTLKTLLDWGVDYGMIWGAHKTQRMAMRYQGNRADPPPVITFDKKEIVPTDTIKTLWVLLNKGGIGYAQLENVKNKIKTIRILILKNYKIRTQAILERLYKTYILPQIIYCSQQSGTP